ncbi:hypothetical protein HRG_010707 [Hirsutella rhossiliensis]|uniref:Autophagy-related protein 29 n=1 Tax=Hirsutella rhossiliensis TaxID=111463 RepID=A0A9P8MQN0_9HYPO|nr:uncharacterized protein HRG_10707 [Hirsutella rhossiliensis]KAH0958406.1 hypothetical protein HRG_10707 [Hirsutella rhossiliensis]
MAEPTYTVFVRIPIPRGDFVDPPPVHWDPTKDEALWKILSGAAQTDIDWNLVAQRFEVPVDFLLQQVAYLTERHASQVRAQVRKATAAARGSAAPSPVPGSEHPRTASALSVRRDSPMPRHDSGSAAPASMAGSGRPGASRNASANTATQKDAGGSSGRLPVSGRTTDTGGRRRLSSLPVASSTAKSPEATPGNDQGRGASPGPAESTSSDDDGSSPAQSRIIRRPPRFQQQEAAQSYHDVDNDDDDEDDEESEPAFQPYRAAPEHASAQDLASTLKGDGRIAAERGHQGSGKDAALQSHTSDSSASSAANLPRPGKAHEQVMGGPLSSPRRAAELAGRSPAGKRRAASREGSEGTPSMGSSFSDLDDASVTQSALEEALASHMNRGAISSRFSISQAFRSRYTPGSSNK